MRQLFVLSEGLTEANFVAGILRSHLFSFTDSLTIAITPIRLDGGCGYRRLRQDAKHLLGRRGKPVAVTTMIDLFRISRKFPGYGAVRDQADPIERVRLLEDEFTGDISDSRFIPYIQTYEFEALLLTDVTVLAEEYPNRKSELSRLAREVSHFQTPEHVNAQHPPSYRIRTAVPEYRKTIAGAKAIERIGLAAIREQCTHFDQWIRRLEGLVSGSNLASAGDDPSLPAPGADS